MASLVSLLSNDILNLCIVINYLCIQAWFSLVYKTKEATQYLLSCLSIGYGQLAHAILSLWFTLLAIPSWLLSTLLPPLLGGGAIAVAVAASAVLLGSSSSSVSIDPTACYLDTGLLHVCHDEQCGRALRCCAGGRAHHDREPGGCDAGFSSRHLELQIV